MEMLDRLNAVTHEAAALLARLDDLMPETGPAPDTGTIGRHAPESKEPWNTAAADAYWGIYFGAREVAHAMQSAVGVTGGAEIYGAPALAVIRNMAPAASDLILRGATRSLESLVSRAQQVPDVDENEAWSPLPRPAGGHPPACPYCRTYGLRMLKRKGEIRCFYPGCTDADGKPTRARIEPGRMTGEERLIFGDGTTMGGGHER